MKITNNFSLPEPIYQAILQAEENYKNSHDLPSDISVTTLIGPTQINTLLKAHGDDLTEDASDRLHILLGAALHNILEMGANRMHDAAMIQHGLSGETGYVPAPVLTEERLYCKIGSWTVSGQYDAYTPSQGLLQDYKLCNVGEHKRGPKPEWVAQLNCLAHLLRENGHTVEKLEAVPYYRD